MCDRIGVVHDGSIAGTLSREQATQAGLMFLALGPSASAGTSAMKSHTREISVAGSIFVLTL